MFRLLTQHDQTPRKRGLCLVAWLIVTGMAASVGMAHAFDFGHARLLSGAGQALRAEMAIVQLSAQELSSLRVNIAPEAAWQQAGLTPPVDLSSLQIALVEGVAPTTRIVRLTSSQVLQTAVADFVIDVQTATGMQRHQVSVVARRPVMALAPSVKDESPGVNVTYIAVVRGDTLFDLAQENAVSGFSVYQMMAALLTVNPHAFIDGNMNLVKAGAVLQVPDPAVLSRLTDRQARQLFIQHAHTYAQRRGGRAAMAMNAAALPIAAAQSDAQALQDGVAGIPQPQPMPYRLILRSRDPIEEQVHAIAPGTRTDTSGDHFQTMHDAIQASQAHVAQLEENVRDLEQVLQALAQEESALADVLTQADHATQAQALTPPSVANLPQQTPTASSTESVPQMTQTPLIAQASQALETLSQHDAGVAPDRVSLPDGQSSEATKSNTAVDAMGAQAPGNTAVSAESAQQTAPASVTQSAAHTVQTPQITPAAAGDNHILWWGVGVALGLLLLIVIWLRRRGHADAQHTAQITDAMIQEKLSTIDLSLDTDDSPRTS